MIKNRKVIPITVDINGAISEWGIRQGLATVTLPKAGAILAIFSALEGTVAAMTDLFSRLPIATEKIKTKLKEEVDLSALVKSAIFPRSLSVPVIDGRLALDPYDDIMVIDFGAEETRREVIVHLLKEDEKPAAAEKSAPERKKG